MFHKRPSNNMRNWLRLLTSFLLIMLCSSFTLEMMGRKGKGSLKKNLDSLSNSKRPTTTKSMNQGRGQEITGVTLPSEGTIKGWEFGNKKRIACANVDNNYYAVQGDCPRCAFDLYKGNIVNEEAFGPEPRVACPTCSTTFSLKTGKSGPAYKRTGLAGFVSNLAKTATISEASADAKAFAITVDDDGVFCRER